MSIKKITLNYSGTVQGVGFRYRTRQIASQYRVCGWVKNLSDGKVEVVAEGEESEIREFLASLEEAFPGHIRGRQDSWSKPEGRDTDFQIRF